MDPIRNSYDWQKLMRLKGRWRPGRPTVLAVRGAELVRGRPSEVGQMPTPEEAPQQEEAPKNRRGRHATQNSE